jgi:hypothetical protein
MDRISHLAFKNMNRVSFQSILNYLTKVSWILFFLCLPVLSFPFFPPAIGGSAIVRPLIIYPLLVLIVVATIPRLISKPIPRTILNLIPFIIAAAISSIFSYRLNISSALGITTTERILRTFITLGLGAGIYFTVTLVPRSLEDLRGTLRWMYAGFSIALLWGSLQAVYIIRFSSSYFQLLTEIQKYISIRKLFATRISGPTYEPNWFAMQLSLLLVPWLLSAVLRDYSVFKWRWRWITVELILLFWSFIIIPITFSRAGLIVLIGVAFIGFIVFRTRGNWLSTHADTPSRLKLSRFIEAGVVVFGVIILAFLVGRNNEFFSRIWLYWSEFNNPTISGYFEYLGFGARFIYGETALRIFNNFPVFGVGLGNYAFFFEEMLPDQPLAIMPEVLRLVTPGAGQTQLITSKNLYFRLLAETGLIGLATFLAFVVAILGCALYLWLSPNKEIKYYGVSGLLGLLAFTLGAFSFDSFAIPNMWVMFGLITAAMQTSRKHYTANGE